MTLAIRPALEADTDACADAMYVAFATVDRRHDFPSYFADLDHARYASRNLILGDYMYGLVAEANGRVVGSAFMNESRPIRGIGPVSVHPDFQGRGIGRRLMTGLLDRAEGAPSVRLTQDAFNVSSLALYTDLGFRVTGSLVLLQGRFRQAPMPEAEVRPVVEADRAACCDLSSRVVGFLRFPRVLTDVFCLVRAGRVTAYTVGLSADAYTVAECEADARALFLGVGALSSGTLALLMPTAYAPLLRWCLRQGFRAVKPLNMMAKGDYKPPQGVYLPNLLY